MSAYGEEYGRMKEKAHRRRKIDTWTFRSPVSGVDPYSVDVYLVNHHSRGLSFSAESKHLENAVEHSDIEKLRSRVEAAMRRQDMKAQKITWEKWIEVELPTEHSWAKESVSALVIKRRPLKRGVHAETGAVFTINNNGIVVPFPRAKRAGEKDKNVNDEDWFQGRDEDTQYSYIPATPANVAALESLCKRLEDLRAALCGLLEQGAVQATLTRETTLRLENFERRQHES